ncbi:hypothetical protein [Spirosoma arcticum]
MEPYQLIDADDLPKNAGQRTRMIARCADLIERTNMALDRHTARSQPDELAIEEYTELRERYVQELRELLQGLRLEGDIHIRQAA